MSNELMQQAAAKDTTDYGQSPLTDDEQKNLVKQIQAEYALAKEHQRESLVTKLARMKLYNNEKKDPKRVSDLSLFSIMQTVLAALYTNKLSAVFEGWEDGDDSVASNLNDMAEYDYKKMKKHILDYFWIWDTCFHGRGLISLEEFDRDEKMMCPVPGYIDAMTFLRDPLASSVNGLIHGDTGMRFGGYEATVLKSSLDAKNGYFNFDDIIYEDEIDSLMEEAKRQRDMAQGLNTVLNRTLSTADLGDNIIYPVLYWYTSFKGKKCKVTLCNSRNKIIKYTVFKKDSFPIIDRPLFPHSNSWDGVSISTIVEDKQRHKSALLNITMDAVKSNVYPSYLYDESRIKNKADIRKMDFNKLIGVKGGQGNLSAALEPVNKADVRVDLVNYILSALDTSAQTASSSPDMQQGQLSGKERTLGELNMVQSNVAKRYSLASKVFSWSEEAFWQEYYWLYKNYFIDGIDEKMIRIRGSFGSKPRKLLKDNIIAEVDPDVYVESKDDNDATNARKRILLQSFAQTIIQDPSTNKRYLNKKMAKINEFKRDEIDFLFPPTADEILAKEENEKLSNNEFVEVSANDNHEVHREINNQSAETAAKAAHLYAHLMMMKIKRDQPELFPNQQTPPTTAGAPTTPSATTSVNMNSAPSSPLAPTP